MKATVKINRTAPRRWAWTIRYGSFIHAGGYCRTRKDARNDASIALNRKPNQTDK